MIRPPPRHTRTDTLVPATQLVRSEPDISGRHHRVACSNAHVARERKRETGARRRPVDDRQRRLRHQVQQPYRLGMVHHRVDALFLALRTGIARRSEEHTSELQSLMRISYAVFCLKKKKTTMR